MNISLPTPLDDLVRKQVESGAYASYSDVVIAALFLLQEREEILRMRRERVLAEVAKGLHQADSRQLVDKDDVLERLKHKPAASEA